MVIFYCARVILHKKSQTHYLKHHISIRLSFILNCFLIDLLSNRAVSTLCWQMTGQSVVHLEGKRPCCSLQKRQRDPLLPRRGSSAFFIYTREQADTVRAELPALRKRSEIIRELSRYRTGTQCYGAGLLLPAPGSSSK